MSETIQQKRPTLSYEIFPPNTQVGDEKIITVLDELKSLKPEFISVTCSNKQRNIELIYQLFIYLKSKCAPLLIN